MCVCVVLCDQTIGLARDKVSDRNEKTVSECFHRLQFNSPVKVKLCYIDGVVTYMWC